jgi:hypothetical protein
MTPLETAILRTVLYADVFNFALTLDELHYYLIYSEPVPRETVQTTLVNSPALQAVLCFAEGYITLLNSSENIAQRQNREILAARMDQPTVRYARWFARIPFVRMVALTGALAARNPASENDDFDYLLVTQPGRVWLARAMAIVLVRLARRQGVELCPNYVLAEDNLLQNRQDLYIARELAQMLPLYGYDVYQAMRQRNTWTAAHLPNAMRRPPDLASGKNYVKRVLEWLLSGFIGDKLEAWEYQRKARRFQQQAQQPGSSAQIDDHSVKGHFQDHGYPILRQYHLRLQQYNITE